MKIENKTIIITDPCYIIREYPGCPDFETWPGLEGLNSSVKFKDYTPEQLRAYETYRIAYENWNKKYDDWHKCAYGKNLGALGLENFLCENTIYGDWSCTTFNKDTNEAIGRFCADAGLVAVLVLEEVLKYNPDFEQWIKEHPWCVTTIENFTGDVNIVHKRIHKIYENEDNESGKTHDTWGEVEVRVVGKGSTNFYTTQTGL